MAFFGVNFILQKFCLCKKNDKYKVWAKVILYFQWLRLCTKNLEGGQRGKIIFSTTKDKREKNTKKMKGANEPEKYLYLYFQQLRERNTKNLEGGQRGWGGEVWGAAEECAEKDAGGPMLS